jgi:hypothetical protein
MISKTPTTLNNPQYTTGSILLSWWTLSPGWYRQTVLNVVMPVTKSLKESCKDQTFSLFFFIHLHT